MDRSKPCVGVDSNDRLDRRMLVKMATGGALAGGMIVGAPETSRTIAAAMIPSNFRALVHVTNDDGLQYAYSALETVTENYDKATARLLVDGSAVKILTTDDGLNSLKSAHDAGAQIAVAKDALAINGIDAATLPDFIDASDPGVIAVVDAQDKGFHYYKL